MGTLVIQTKKWEKSSTYVQYPENILGTEVLSD